MKKITISLIFLLVLPVVAEDYVRSVPPAVAASTPVFEISTGYQYLVLDTPARKRVGLSGVDANGFIDFNSHWGLALDSSYARANDVLGTGHSGNVVSALAGPVFYPFEYGNTRFFVHTLAGTSLVNSAVPVHATYYLGGTIMRFSYAVGGGIERTIAGPVAIRFGAEYLRTTFADPSAEMQFQNNVRFTTSIVYRWGSR